MRATCADRIRQARARAQRRGGHDRPRRRARAAGSRPRAGGWRSGGCSSAKAASATTAATGRSGRGEDRDRGAHADAEQRDRSEASRRAGSRTAAATSRRSCEPSVTRLGAALAVPAKVELEHVVALVEPRHEGRQLAAAGCRVKPCSTITAVARLAGRGNQPARERDAVIGREADRLVVEADVGRSGRRVRPHRARRAARPGRTSSRDPRTAT